MWSRCRDPKNLAFEYYGARGIEVCESWQAFEVFLEDMGERPSGKCIERIDNNGNYEPRNCRWATMMEQARNTSLTSRADKRAASREEIAFADGLKLSGDDLKNIRKLLAQHTQREVAHMFGVTPERVWQIKRNYRSIK